MLRLAPPSMAGMQDIINIYKIYVEIYVDQQILWNKDTS